MSPRRALLGRPWHLIPRVRKVCLWARQTRFSQMLRLVGILIAQRRRRSWKSWSWTPVYSHPIAYCPKTADFTPYLPESQCFLFLRVSGRYGLWTCLSTRTCIELKSLRSVYLLAASLTWASCWTALALSFLISLYLCLEKWLVQSLLINGTIPSVMCVL